MDNTERREKLAEIFGKRSEYFEDWFSPDDFDERDAAVAKKIGKPLNEIKFGDVFDYIDQERPEIKWDFRTCMLIAKDAQKHGRVWTEDNPLKTLVNRKDISILEAFTIYEVLCGLLGLGRDK